MTNDHSFQTQILILVLTLPKPHPRLSPLRLISASSTDLSARVQRKANIVIRIERHTQLLNGRKRGCIPEPLRVHFKRVLAQWHSFFNRFKAFRGPHFDAFQGSPTGYFSNGAKAACWFCSSISSRSKEAILKLASDRNISTRLYEALLSCGDVRSSLHRCEYRVNRMQVLHHLVQNCLGPLARFPRIVEWSTVLVTVLRYFPKKVSRFFRKDCSASFTDSTYSMS
jgi:hypothetical protein